MEKEQMKLSSIRLINDSDDEKDKDIDIPEL